MFIANEGKQKLITDNYLIMNYCRCLLKQAGEEELAQTVSEYISTLAPDIKADDELYRARLDKCGKCTNLNSGVCMKCGCYVEMRAAVRKNRCPSEEKLW